MNFTRRKVYLTISVVKYTLRRVKNKVSEYREKFGLSITGLAEICEVSRQTIHSIEKGTFKPSVLLAIKIAQALQTHVEELFVLEKGD